MIKYPKKIKAFFFSDIESSTRLAQQLGESYALVLERHRTVIRMANNKYSGREIDTSGDGFFIVFDQPEQAVAAAVLIQKAFASKTWAKKLNLKVRIGIHFGQALTTESGFTGLEVHRASRICNAGHGGQVVISKKVRDKAKNKLPQDVTLKKLGKYQLKDFDQTDELYQLVIPNTQTEFPPLRISFSKPNVAILPFTNLSKDPEQEYFCDGISEEIILALDSSSGLGVVARSSAFALKGKSMDVRDIGKQLGATAVLEGTVRKIDNHLRISVELVDTYSGLNIWSDRYDRKIEDVFKLQDEIALNIARALEVKLLPESKHGIQDRQTSNIEAYDFYLKGRKFYYQYSNNSVKLALQMFKKAIEIDDEYALAYCGLADCYAYLFMYEESSEENMREANLASLQAMELAPLLAEAYASRGVALTLKKQYKKAEASFEKAIELNPSLFEAWYHYGRASFAQGKLDRAARLFDEASRTHPDDYQAIMLAGQAYDQLGIKVLARKARQRGVAIVEKHLQLNPGDTRALYLGANGLIALGEKEKGMEWLRRALTLEPDDPMVLYNAGCIYAMLNMKEEALHCLEHCFEAGLKLRGWYENDSNLDSVRNHPRFKALLSKMN
jgi:adenylate cyclase